MSNILHTKKLPSDRSSQPKTLFVLSAHDIARVFVVEKHDLQELNPLHTQDTDYNYSDKEGFSYSTGSGGGTIPGFSEKDRMHYDHIFVKFLVQEIGKLDHSVNALRIVIYLPVGLKKIFVDAIPKAYVSKFEVYVGNHLKTTFADVIKILSSVKDEQVIM